MTPVFQTITRHDPASGQYGNCLQAAVASLLDLPLSEVPHFCDGLPDGVEGSLLEGVRLNDFLAKRGLQALDESFTPESLRLWQTHWEQRETRLIHIMAGMSPRGHFHATVGCNGVVVHDPHPDGGGIALTDGLWHFTFFVFSPRA